MNRRIKILIAEDDQDEQLFIREGFEESGAFDIVNILSNGYQLLKELEKLAEEALPDIILSDINMPLMTGTEALAIIKNNPALASVPFVVFSSSKESQTREYCFSLGADEFLLKPPTFDYNEFIDKLKELYANLHIK
jgi:CheY-like chemotaxis protein